MATIETHHLFLRNPEYITNSASKIHKVRRINGKNLAFPENGKRKQISARVTSIMNVNTVPQRTPQWAPVVSPAGWKGVAQSHAEAVNDPNGKYLYHGSSIMKGGSFTDGALSTKPPYQTASPGRPTGWIERIPLSNQRKKVSEWVWNVWNTAEKVDAVVSTLKNPNYKLPVAYGPR